MKSLFGIEIDTLTKLEDLEWKQALVKETLNWCFIRCCGVLGVKQWPYKGYMIYNVYYTIEVIVIKYHLHHRVLVRQHYTGCKCMTLNWCFIRCCGVLGVKQWPYKGYMIYNVYYTIEVIVIKYHLHHRVLVRQHYTGCKCMTLNWCFIRCCGVLGVKQWPDNGYMIYNVYYTIEVIVIINHLHVNITKM